MKPLDENLLRNLAIESDVMITIEEGSIGGFGSHVLHFLTNDGLLDYGTLKFRSMVIPDEWIEAGPQKDQYDIAKLNQPHIVYKIQQIVDMIKNYRFVDFILNVCNNPCPLLAGFCRPKRVMDIKAENVSPFLDNAWQ